jgi:sulfite exporter TauE/SafE
MPRIVAVLDLALFFSALLLGAGGMPHCAAMCSAACTAACGGAGPGRAAGFQLGRLLGYAGGGALAASSVAWLAEAGAVSALLRPLWGLLHAAALGLGLWMLWQGRHPLWLERPGRRPQAPASPDGWQRVQGPVRASAVGLAWVAWPCGLLQSALMLAALAQSAAGGALVMAGFAMASASGLLVGPLLWARLAPAGAAAALASGTWAARLAGAMLALASSWALGHGLWQRVLAWCAA